VSIEDRNRYKTIKENVRKLTLKVKPNLGRSTDCPKGQQVSQTPINGLSVLSWQAHQGSIVAPKPIPALGIEDRLQYLLFLLLLQLDGPLVLMHVLFF